MKKVILTGATGYIGANLVIKLLEKKYEVHIIARKESKLNLLEDVKEKISVFIYEGENIESLIKYMKNMKDSIVIHLASLCIAEHKTSQVNDLIDSNIKFGTNILEAMSVSGIKYFINTSTTWQHFNDEDYNPVCLYAATKESFEKIMKYYYEVFGINCTTLEIYDSYGPRDNRPKLFNYLNKIANENLELNMSKGEQSLDLVYIDDIVCAYITCVQMMLSGKIGFNEKYSLSSANRISLRELVELYGCLVGKKLKINWGARPYRKREVMTPWSSGTRLPGWHAKILIKEGIMKILDSEKK